MNQEHKFVFQRIASLPGNQQLHKIKFCQENLMSLNQALEGYQQGKTRRRRKKSLPLQKNLEKTETTIKVEEPNK